MSFTWSCTTEPIKTAAPPRNAAPPCATRRVAGADVALKEWVPGVSDIISINGKWLIMVDIIVDEYRISL